MASGPKDIKKIESVDMNSNDFKDSFRISKAGKLDSGQGVTLQPSSLGYTKSNLTTSTIPIFQQYNIELSEKPLNPTIPDMGRLPQISIKTTKELKDNSSDQKVNHATDLVFSNVTTKISSTSSVPQFSTKYKIETSNNETNKSNNTQLKNITFKNKKHTIQLHSITYIANKINQTDVLYSYKYTKKDGKNLINEIIINENNKNDTNIVHLLKHNVLAGPKSIIDELAKDEKFAHFNFAYIDDNAYFSLLVAISQRNANRIKEQQDKTDRTIITILKPKLDLLILLFSSVLLTIKKKIVIVDYLSLQLARIEKLIQKHFLENLALEKAAVNSAQEKKRRDLFLQTKVVQKKLSQIADLKQEIITTADQNTSLNNKIS